MTVWIVHPVTDDLSAAGQYGEFRYINKKYIYPDMLEGKNGDEIPSTAVDAMVAAADEFNPETDYLCIAGDHLQLIAFTATLISNFDWFRVLRYDRQARGYLPVVISSRG